MSVLFPLVARGILFLVPGSHRVFRTLEGRWTRGPGRETCLLPHLIRRHKAETINYSMGYNKIISYGNTLEIFEYEREIYRLMGRREEKRKDNSRNENVESSGEDMLSKRQLGKRPDNARRSVVAFRRIVASNLGGSARPLLVTLTYRDNFTELNGAYKHHSAFVQSLRHKYGKTFKYISVPEFQKRGAVHFHALFWGLPERLVVRERKAREIAKIWGKGFVFLKETDGDNKLAVYLAKYMSKAFIDPRLKNQKAYTASRNIQRPIIQKGPFPIDFIFEEFNVVGEAIVDKTYTTSWLGDARYRVFRTET